MRWRTLFNLFCVVLFVVTLASGSYLRVADGEQVLITRFGAPVGEPIVEPGRHYKVPALDKVHRFSSGPLPYQDRGLEVAGQRLDLTVHWRISEALVFYHRFQAEDRARARLVGIFREDLRKVVTIDDGTRVHCRATAGASGQDVCARLLEMARTRFEDLGIEIQDVELSPSLDTAETGA